MNEKVVRTGIALVLAAAIFCACFSFGYGVGSSGLDPSWSQVLGYAWTHHLQWGTEIVFTYGPYGAMAPGAAFDPDCYNVFLLVQFALSLALAVAATYLTLAWRDVASFLLLLLLCVAHAERGDWQPFLLYVLSFAAIHRYTTCAPNGWGAAALAAATFVVTLAALIKFSFVPLWLLWLACLGATIVFRRQYWLCLTLVASALFSFIFLWLAARQSIANIPDYFLRSLELARHFGSAMSTPPEPGQLRVGLALLAWSLLNLSWPLRHYRSRFEDASLALFLAGAVFLGWKAGFTRADSHVSSFYLIAASTLIIACGARIGIQMPRHLYATTSAIAALIAMAALAPFAPNAPQPLWRMPITAIVDIKVTLSRLLAFPEFRTSRQAQREDAAKQADLPRIRALVADAPADLYTSNQAAIILNRMNYHPRPVFQSYAAYSPALAALNKRAVVDDLAPEYLLVQLDGMDGRLPTLDDSPALTEVLRRYDPKLVERDVLLLHRHPPSTMPELERVSSRNAALGEKLALPCQAGMSCYVRMQIGLTPLGRLYTALLGEPVLQIDVAEQNGRSASFRLTRGQADAGFLASPFYMSTVDFAIATTGRDPHPLRSLSVHAQSPRMAFAFEATMTVDFSQAPMTRTDTQLPGEIVAWAYPGFDHLPLATSGDVRPMDFDGRRVLLVHAPATVEVPSGTARSISFDFGIANDAWSKPATCPGTDGVDFSIVRGTDAHAERLYARRLDPTHNEGDRGPQHVELPLSAYGTAEPLTIQTSVGPAGDSSCDWAWIANVSLAQAPSQ